MLFAYLGPDTMLPLTSVFAAVVGVALMFGRQVLRVGWLVVGKARGLVARRAHPTSAAGARTHGAHAGTTRPATRRPRRTTDVTDRVDS